TPGGHGMNELESVWQAAMDELRDEVVSPQQKAYLRLTRLRAIVEDTALLSVPNAQVREIIEQRLRPAITDALTRVLGRSLQVVATVRPPEEVAATTVARPATLGSTSAVGAEARLVVPLPRQAELSPPQRVDGPRRPGDPAPEAYQPLIERPSHGRPVPSQAEPGASRLSHKYRFETFVIGSSNRFAHAAAVAVAES